MPLTPKQKLFVAEYALDRNGAAAARRAGYSEKSAREIGRQLLQRPDVAAAIEAEMKARTERTGISADRLVQELVSLALYDPGTIASAKITGPGDIAKLPETTRRAIVGWSWDRNGNFILKLSPKTPSIDMLAKHVGLYGAERHEHSGPGGGPIETKVHTPDDVARKLAAFVAEAEAKAKQGKAPTP